MPLMPLIHFHFSLHHTRFLVHPKRDITADRRHTFRLSINPSHTSIPGLSINNLPNYQYKRGEVIRYIQWHPLRSCVSRSIRPIYPIQHTTRIFARTTLRPHNSEFDNCEFIRSSASERKPHQTMASASFRESINSLGWSRRDRDRDYTANTSQTSGLLSSMKSLNPFGDRGYVQLPTTEGAGAPLPASNRRDEEEGWFVLSRWDRMLIFGACNLGALACFVLCFALWPILMTKPRKFVILWSFGSVLFLSSFAAMMGPMAYAQHLVSGSRLPFTAAYFGSIAMTIYFSVGLHSTTLTLLAAIVQLACLLWYLVSYFPMGSSGLRLATSFGARRAATWMTG